MPEAPSRSHPNTCEIVPPEGPPRSHPWPTHARSLSLDLPLPFPQLSITLSSSLSPFDRVSKFNECFVLIFVCFKFIYWNFLLWNLFESWENDWEISRKIAFSECNQTLRRSLDSKYKWLRLRFLTLFFFFLFQPHYLTKSAVNSARMHCSRTHKFHFSVTFSLKMGPTTLFTHLKMILLQCFQFSISAK